MESGRYAKLDTIFDDLRIVISQKRGVVNHRGKL